MDLNLTVIAGTLAAPPEVRTFESGTSMARLLVVVRTTEPTKRTDVLPVVVWSPDDDLLDLDRGDRVWCVGAAQRRFWSAPEGRRSRIELVAHHVEVIGTAVPTGDLPTGSFV